MNGPPVVPVLSPSGGTGGVEHVAVRARRALSAECEAVLHAGPAAVVRMRRSRHPWLAATWKTHALGRLSHPGSPRGFVLVHGAELTRDKHPLSASARRRALSSARLLLAVSPVSLQLLPPELHDRVELVGPPVRLPRRTVRDVPRSEDQLRLVSVGRAVPRKGHDTAIAVGQLLGSLVPVRLDVIGPGPDVGRLRAQAARTTDGLDVRVHGGLPPASKRRLVAAADVLLFLARTEGEEYEGLGMVVLEAAAFGVPSVVLDCGGARYGLDSTTGRLLPESAGHDEVAAAVLSLIADPSARPAAARRAAHFALPDWEARMRTIVLHGERPGWTWPSPAPLHGEVRTA